MNKKTTILLLILCFIFGIGFYVFCQITNSQEKYYIKKDKEYKLEFLCFSEDDCYNATPNRTKIKDKNFIEYGGGSYDIDSYKYDSKNDTYYVDIVKEMDMTTCGGYNSPYDDGVVDYLIFGLKISPSKKEYSSTYKGFISSVCVTENGRDGKPIAMYDKFLNIYYDDNPNLIPDTKEYIAFMNEAVQYKMEGYSHSSYEIEVTKLLKRHIWMVRLNLLPDHTVTYN